MSCFIFTDIPGSGKNWTLAVFAINKQDALRYIKACHGNGRFITEVKSGEVHADCGAVTDKYRQQEWSGS